MAKHYQANKNDRKNRKSYVVLSAILLAIILSIGVFAFRDTKTTSIAEKQQSSETTTMVASVQETQRLAADTITTNLDYIYLSDIDYTADSSTGWGSIQKDLNPDGGTIQLRKDGEIISYTKGMGLHANGQLVYDIADVVRTYPHFIAKVGVNVTKTAGNLKVSILAQREGTTTWETLVQPTVKTAAQDQLEVDLPDLTGYKYLKIVANANGENAGDHLVLGDARFVKADYSLETEKYSKIHTLEYYDNILSAQTPEYNMENNYRLILEREFVRKIGYWSIQNLALTSPDALEAMNWILDDTTNNVLEQVIEVGEISDGAKFLTALGKIHHANTDALETENGYVYQKMMIGESAAYSTDAVHRALAFSTRSATYDPVVRFSLFKQLFDEGKFYNWTNGFKNLHVELMRMVMHDDLRDDEVIWMNRYTREVKRSITCWWLTYKSTTYTQPIYYSEANRATYDAKYHLTEFGVPYGDNVPRHWMIMEGGGICWGISRISQSFQKASGIPSVGAYQPGHEPYMIYSEKNGKGVWNLSYNNKGWEVTGNVWGNSSRYRLIFDWGNKSFSRQKINGSSYQPGAAYIFVGQAALNDYENFKPSFYYNLLANSYPDNETKLEVYDKALDHFDANLDCYDNILKMYKEMGDEATEEMWLAYANDVIDSFTFYPNAMVDILLQVKPYLSGGARAEIDLKERAALLKAKNECPTTHLQRSGVIAVANSLLGSAPASIATFSFDGENGGKIVINDQYNIKWSYSLDGGKTWSNGVNVTNTNTSENRTAERSIDLKANGDINKITAENDIILAMDGTGEKYTIAIEQGALPTVTDFSVTRDLLYGNDLENRVVGVDLTMEWRYTGTEEWTSYKDSSPVLTGNKSVQVRVGPTGNRKESDSVTFEFTEDSQPIDQKYIPVSHLSVHGVSSESTAAGYKMPATNAIDGNYNTRWFNRTSNNGDPDRYISIKLDKPVILSALEYVPGLTTWGTNYGWLRSGEILASKDGENWVTLVEISGLPEKYDEPQMFVIPEEKRGEYQYVKLHAATTSGQAAHTFISARAINLFQDLTDRDHPTAGIAYDTTYKTNKDVTARIINFSSDTIKITKPEDGSDTYVFTDNGEFTFEFVDTQTGLTGSATARVDWINRIPPEVEIEYSTTNPTNGSVIATVKPKNKDIVLLNAGRDIRDEQGNFIKTSGKFTLDEDGDLLEHRVIRNAKGTIVDTTGKYTLDSTGRVVDQDGNVIQDVDKNLVDTSGRFTIDDANNLIEQRVINDFVKGEDGNIYNAKGEVIAEPEDLQYEFIENGEYTFEFVGTAGNTGTATAKVTWIDTTIPQAVITYDREERTNQNVTATIAFDKENVTVINNDGKKTYTFTDNGEFTFYFTDALGNTGEATARVDWIDRIPPEATITYDRTTLTNQDVTATVTFDDYNVTILNNNGSTTYTFTKNGSFTFQYRGRAGNEGTATATVDWIDKEAPVATVAFDKTELTNQNVTATITFNEENVTITNNNGSNKYTFIENDTFTFEFRDAAGNTGTKDVIVDWIDKEPIIASITYDRDTSTETDQDITATIAFDKKNVTITNNDGKNTYTFSQNGEFTFEYVDKAGNTGTATARVDCIHKGAIIVYSTQTPTNQDVTATIVAQEEIEILNNNGENTYVFKKNGEFTFQFQTINGIERSITAKVTWIDKEAPTASIEYSTTEETTEPVTATLVNPSEEIKIVNNGGQNKYIFTKNGTFTFEIEDLVGNKSTVTAEVTWIEDLVESSKLTSSKYEVKDSKVSKIPAGTTIEQFKKNASAKREIVIQDKNGKVLPQGTKIGTGMKAVVGINTYTLIVSGDTNGDGDVTITDLAKLCLHYIEDTLLEDVYKEAADMDYNGKITVNDLAKIQLILIGKNK